MGLRLATKYTTRSGSQYIVDPIARMWGYYDLGGIRLHQRRLESIQHTEGDPKNVDLLAMDWIDGPPGIGQRMWITNGKMDGWRISTAIAKIEEVESPWGTPE